MTERLCPGCGLGLTPGRLGAAALDRCLFCAGIWLGTAALRELLTAGEAAARRLREQAGPPDARGVDHAPEGGCPGCGRALARMVMPDMPRSPVFACAPCRGFWLPLATLDRLVASPDESADASGPCVCADCGERNPASAACCRACGRVLQGVAARACPACNGVVRRISGTAFPAGACESCGGAWLPAGALHALLFLPAAEQARFLQEATRLHTGAPRPARQASCPSCAVAMESTSVGRMAGQTFNSCGGCGAHFVTLPALQEMMLGTSDPATTRIR